ncbi:ribonuclease P protein component [Sphingomonas tabacisoli]|uniref:Ribonuclease P protein component n=1 Tax=Sphingomonas tabacisoli TaxID=2249466 RepID=A0ABW4I1S5_9SPHN
MTRRADFLAANAGKRAPMPGFVLLVRPRDDGDSAMRYGITVTKKIGGAVVRNRMKRRFRALVAELLPERGMLGADHVLIGRAGGVERDFGLLRTELAKALKRLSPNAVRPELVKGLPSSFSETGREGRASTSSAQTGERA